MPEVFRYTFSAAPNPTAQHSITYWVGAAHGNTVYWSPSLVTDTIR